MQTNYYKNDTGYIAVYPTKAIYAQGKRIPPTVLICGLGAQTPYDPSTVAEKVFNHSQLGKAVSADSIPDAWRKPLGLSEAVPPKPKPTRSVEVVVHALPTFSGNPDDLIIRFLTLTAIGGWSAWWLALLVRLFIYPSAK